MLPPQAVPSCCLRLGLEPGGRRGRTTRNSTGSRSLTRIVARCCSHLSLSLATSWNRRALVLLGIEAAIRSLPHVHTRTLTHTRAHTMSEPKPPNKIWIRYRKDPNAKLQVARFQTCYPMDLTKLAPPIHMMRERDPPPEETPAAAPTAAPGTSSSSSAATAAAASSSSSAPAGSAAATAAGATPAPIPSLYAGVPLHQRPWILEDSDQSRFRGTEEKGAQTSSSYFVFMQERPGEYTAIPVESWFNFRPHSLAKAAAIEGVEQEVRAALTAAYALSESR